MSASGSSVDDELFREILLDHYRRPRHHGAVDPSDASCHGHNPLCGDEVDISLRLDGGRLAAIGFEGQGCSISMASASMMAEQTDGKSLSEVHQAIDNFRAMLVEGQDPAQLGEMGDLEALQGVHRYATRVKCAMLPWIALDSALADAESSAG